MDKLVKAHKYNNTMQEHNQTSVKERIKAFIKYKRTTEREFASSIGVSSGYVSAINKSIQPDKIDKIMKQYPELNVSWLITGEGDMILQNEERNKNISHLNNEKNMVDESYRNLMKVQMDTLRLQNEMIVLLNDTIKQLTAELSKYIVMNK